MVQNNEHLETSYALHGAGFLLFLSKQSIKQEIGQMLVFIAELAMLCCGGFRETLR
jgi:hypothetical protein